MVFICKIGLREGGRGWEVERSRGQEVGRSGGQEVGIEVKGI
jgi:hypothetical protein